MPAGKLRSCYASTPKRAAPTSPPNSRRIISCGWPLQALSGCWGGRRACIPTSMDEAYGWPTKKSVRVALRTQQIIAHESGVAHSIDPLAGSYLIEYLTDEIEQRAMEYIQKIDTMGGALKHAKQGYIQGEIPGCCLPGTRWQSEKR